MQRPCHWLAGILAMLPLVSHAQSDWIDEFPPVTTVALAAYEELKATSERGNPSSTQDDDAIAVNLAGTFVVLRQIMFLKYNEEPPMSREREDKLRKLVAAYEEAELTIGSGAPCRQGYITREPPSGMGCADAECYQRWFLLHLNSSSSRASYRERVLKRLFAPGRAQELNDLRQRHATRIPYFDSPAVTLRVEPELAGLAPAGCTAYGGDTNQNGLCNDWEKPFGRGTAVAAASACTQLAMDEVRMAPGSGLVVTLAKNSGTPGATASFRVWRSSKPALGGDAQRIWAGEATIQPGTKPGAPLQVLLAQGADLERDQKRRYLLVEATSDSGAAPVHCEQPLKNELGRHRVPGPNGLHGGYDSIEDALRLDDVTLIALQLMGAGFDTAETGFLVIRDARIRPGGKGAYYTTSAVRSSAEPSVYGRPIFLGPDYGRSLDEAFRTSCENMDDFAVVATVHTHPDKFDVVEDNFSIPDFEILFEMRAKGVAIEKMFMLSARDCRVRMFTPLPSDRLVYGVIDALNPYLERVKILPIGLSPIPPLCRPG
jgi:hypothetical protein